MTWRWLGGSASFLGWAGAMLPATGVLLLAALLLDRLLERRVSGGDRILSPPDGGGAAGAAGGLGDALGRSGRATVAVSGDAPTNSRRHDGRTSDGRCDQRRVLAGGGVPGRRAGGRAAGGRRRGWRSPTAAPGAAGAGGRGGAGSLGRGVRPPLWPLVSGSSPRIVLPRTLADQDPDEALRCVLRHERAHLERRDHVLMAVLQLTLVVAWPILPLWIRRARVRALVELASDERALRARPWPSGAATARCCWRSPRRGSSPRFSLEPAFGAVLRGRLRAPGRAGAGRSAEQRAGAVAWEPRPSPARPAPSRLRLPRPRRTTACPCRAGHCRFRTPSVRRGSTACEGRRTFLRPIPEEPGPPNQTGAIAKRRSGAASTSRLSRT